MRASALIVRDFDGSRREIIGEVDFPIFVGPQQFIITFQVMDTHPAYSCLLGRPWIHAVSTRTFTLYQKLKFLFEDKLVIVYGDKDSIISELSSFIYVKTEEGIYEVPFQGLNFFEEVSSTFANQSQSTIMVLSSSKSAKQTLENGPLPCWGQIVRVSKKHDRFGLDYCPTSHHPTARGGKRFNPVRFSSTGYQLDSSVAIVDWESFSERAVFGLIRKCPLGFKLDNWISVMVLVVFSKEI